MEQEQELEQGTEVEQKEIKDSSKEVSVEQVQSVSSEQAEQPVEYKFSFKTGQELDEEYVKGFTEMAKELNLSQEQAQRIISANAEYLALEADRVDKTLVEQAEAYEAEARRELGAHFEESISYAAKALDKYDTSGALRKVLNVLPIGNNVELIKVFAKMGKDIAEDKFVNSGFTGGEKSIEERLYPKQK